MRIIVADWKAGVAVALVALGSGLGVAHGSAAWTYSVPRIRLPLMKAPAMKGAFKPDQWAGADEMTGFTVNAPGGTLAPWAAHFWVGGNTKDLFVAVETQTPPGGKLLARVNPLPFGMNAHLAMIDDTVEIFVDPSPAAASSPIYQVMFNAKGAIWQQKFKTRGTSMRAWHGHWKIVNKIVGNRWDCRVAIPWQDFGIKHIAGRTVAVRIGRDWLQVPRGGWVQSQWAPNGGGYADVATMPRVTFDSAAPVVQVRRLQNKPDGAADIKMSIFNPASKPLRVRSLVEVVPRDDKTTRQLRVLTLAPHQTKIVDVSSVAVAVAGEPLYTRIQVSSANGKPIFYSREFSWKINRPERLWSLNHGASKRIDTAFMYYPSINAMQVRVNLSDLANRSKVTAVQLQVRGQKTGKIVASTTMPPIRKNMTRLREWKIPPLNGQYDLAVRLEGIHAKPQVLPFVRYHFKWEHNQLGRGKNIIVPPFNPIQVHGKTVGVVLRQYTMNGLGLWSQVNAADQNLLSKPMRMVVRAGGKRFVGHGQLKFTQIKPTQVIAVAHWQAGPLKGSSRSVWDYDGMMKTTLTLEPTKKTLDSVSLVIPMVNKEMPLMTACTDGVRFNYSGKVPAGAGEVWNGSLAPRNSIIGSFVPYIWTGGPVRGIAVFGDNDAGWVDYQAKTPCQELVRKADGTLELRLNLVAKPARLKTVHTILLGFQATPIKPMPKNWRWWTENAGVPGAIHTVFAGACLYWGCRTAFGDIYPRGHDFGIYKQLEITRRTGKIDQAFITKWLAGYKWVPGHIRRNPLSHYGPSIRGMFSSMAGHPQAVVTYTNPAAMRVDTPAGRTYLNEWDRHVFPSRQYYRGDYFDFTVNPCRSFRDFALWYYDKLLTTFDDGIYWDNMFLKSDFNTVLTNAYRLPDGYVQPATTLWTERALVRRTAILDAQLHKPDLNMIHMTNTAIAPVLAFAGIDLDLEDKYGSSPFQSRFSRAFLLTEIAGRQFGNIPMALSGLSGNTPKQLAWVRRTYAGVVLTMEMRGWDGSGPCYWRNYARLVKFGYGTPRTKTWDYWHRGYPMGVFGDKTSSIIVSKRGSKPGQAIIVVCDWGHGGTIRLRINAAKLHLAGRLAVTNMGTKKPVQIAADGAIVFHLKKDDFKMLMVKASR